MLSKGRFCCSSRSLPQEWVEQSLDEPRASHGGQAARAMRLCVSGSIGHMKQGEILVLKEWVSNPDKDKASAQATSDYQRWRSSCGQEVLMNDLNN